MKFLSVRREPSLVHIFVEPTARCNLHCRLCFTGRGDVAPKPDMTFEEFAELVSQIPPSCDGLSLYNFGETFLHPDACRMIALAARRGITVDVATNFNIDPGLITPIARSGLHELYISLDGITQESYETYRVGGSLELVVANTRRLIEERKRLGSSRPRVMLQFLVMGHNEHEIEGCRRLGRELGVDQVLFKTVCLRTYHSEAQMLPAAPGLRRYEPDGRPKQVTSECSWPWGCCTVLCDGMVQPCCQIGHAPGCAMGNALSQGLMEVWHGARYREFRAEMEEGRPGIPACETCCSGPMHAEA